MSGITMKVEGRRVYVFGNTYAIKDAIKSAGGHWDSERRAWLIGSAKQAELQFKIDGSEPKEQNVDEIKVVGKAKYKGRTYYVRWFGQCKSGAYKAHLTTLDGKIDFWAACAQPHEQHIDGSGDVASVVKTYPGRENCRTGRVEYTTLGSIRRFIERQSNPSTARVQCPECDSWHNADERCNDCGGC